MNAHLHIVYSPVGGIPELLKDYIPKSVLGKVSSDEIVRVLDTLITRIPEKDTGSILYAQKFDWSNITKNTLDVYADISTKQV